MFLRFSPDERIFIFPGVAEEFFQRSWLSLCFYWPRNLRRRSFHAAKLPRSRIVRERAEGKETEARVTGTASYREQLYDLRPSLLRQLKCTLQGFLERSQIVRQLSRAE